MNKKNKHKAGFSLVELLVVIAIIGILATLAVISLQQARKNARDAKRIADVKQIQTALELYFNDWQEYPSTLPFGSVSASIATGTNVYMAVLPSAPSPADGACSSANNTYKYKGAETDNGSYILSFCLGGKTGGLDAGPKCAHPGGITDEDCSDQFD